jgi:two-component system sensor histidine kinase KdpD
MAAEEAGRLNQLVGNLLEMTRLEAGAVRVHREPRDVQDLIGATLRQMSERLGDRPVTVEVPPDLPLIPLDSVLVAHVLMNLIDNTCKYSPPASPIEIRAHATEAEIEVEVVDQGFGIPAEDQSHVFEKFFRVQRPETVSGIGLGLPISKGLVEAHGGRIWAQNRPGGGTVVTMTLPRSVAEPPPQEGAP